MTPVIAFSRGFGRFDNTPEQREVTDATALISLVVADRASAKGEQWISAPFGQRCAKALALGKPHRCAECADPVAFLGLDIDGGLDREGYHALVMAAHRYRGVTYETASSTLESPRCRLLLLLDAGVSRADRITLSRKVREEIDQKLLTAGHSAPVWDASCDRPEQPLYLPLETAAVYPLDGELIHTGAYFEEPMALGDLLPLHGRRSASPLELSPHPTPACHPDGGKVVDIDRHGDLLAFAFRQAREVARGMARESAMAAFREERARGRWTRHVTDREFEDALDGALRKVRAADQAGPANASVSGVDQAIVGQDAAHRPLTVVDISDLKTAQAPTTQYVFDPIVPRGVLTLLGAHGGTGKSLLMLTMAAHAACGRDWAGFPSRGPCRVVFASLEDSGKTVRQRLSNIVKHFQLDCDLVVRNLVVLDGADVDATLVTEVSEFGSRRLRPTARWDELYALIEGADLVVIDNASDTYDGDENNRRQVRQYLRLLTQGARTNNSGLVLLAHIDKAAAINGSKGNSYSGSTAWHNSARSRLAMIANDQDGITKVVLRHEKNNLGPLAMPVLFRRQDVGDGGTVLVAEHEQHGLDVDGEEAATSQVTLDADKVEGVLQLACAAEIDVPAAMSGPLTAMHVLGDFPELPKVYRSGTGKTIACRPPLSPAHEACSRSGDKDGKSQLQARSPAAQPYRDDASRGRSFPDPGLGTVVSRALVPHTPSALLTHALGGWLVARLFLN